MKRFLILVLLAAGCQTPPMTLRFHEQMNDVLPDSYVQAVEVPRAGVRVPVSRAAALTERDVASAELMETAGGLAVVVRFDPHGAMALDELTTRNRGRYLVALVNGRPVTAWLIDRRLFSGQFILEGDLSDEEAQQLVKSLNQRKKRW